MSGLRQRLKPHRRLEMVEPPHLVQIVKLLAANSSIVASLGAPSGFPSISSTRHA
jgi:hypothetical protein